MVNLIVNAIVCLVALSHVPATIPQTTDVTAILIHVNEFGGFEALFIDDVDGVDTLVDYSRIDPPEFFKDNQTGHIVVRFGHWNGDRAVSADTLAIQYGGERPLQSVREYLNGFRTWPRPRIHLRGLAD